MNITENDYNLHIKPCIDKMYESIKKFNETEKLMTIDVFTKILQNEFNFEILLTTLKNLTDLQLEIGEKYEFNLDKLTLFLENKKG